MLRLPALLSVTAALLAGCATEHHGPGLMVCDWAAPIRHSRADQMTDATARQILAHNETGARLCGWQP
jgi:hypothetical protein